MPVEDCAFLVFHAYGHSKFQPVYRSRTEAATGSRGTSSQKIWARTVDTPAVLPAAPTSSAALWVKPGMLPDDVRPALASAGSASIPCGSASSITGGAHVVCSILGQARYAASRRAACISAARAAAWARLSAGTAPQSVESPSSLRTRVFCGNDLATCFHSQPWQ